MQRAIELSKKIAAHIDEDCYAYLVEVNLHDTFDGIISLGLSNKQTNVLICSVILSYDNESKWIDLRTDGYDINKNVLKGMGADLNESIFQEFIELKNENIRDAIGAYLDLLPDWRFVTARKMIDYHARYVRETENALTGVDDDKKIKARENIGKLIKESVAQRRAADELILQIQKDYVTTNHKVDSDFNVNYIDTTIKEDILSWRDFIKKRNASKA